MSITNGICLIKAKEKGNFKDNFFKSKINNSKPSYGKGNAIRMWNKRDCNLSLSKIKRELNYKKLNNMEQLWKINLNLKLANKRETDL